MTVVRADDERGKTGGERSYSCMVNSVKFIRPLLMVVEQKGGGEHASAWCPGRAPPPRAPSHGYASRGGVAGRWSWTRSAAWVFAGVGSRWGRRKREEEEEGGFKDATG